MVGGGLPQVGAVATLENIDGFLSDTQKMEGALTGLNGPLETTATKSADVDRAARQMAGGLADIGKIALGVGVGLTALTVGIATSAAKLDEMGIALNVAGTNAGFSEEALAGFEAGLRKTGLSMTGTRQFMLKLIQSQVDLNESTKLARVAQDLAVVGMRDSTETANLLADTLATGNVRYLRQLGIVTTTTQALQAYGASQGLAGDELKRFVAEADTGTKRLALLNTIYTEGAKFSGVYEEAMNNWGKQMRSLIGREIPDMAAGFGEVLQPAFLGIIKTAREIVQALNNLSPGMKATIATVTALAGVSLTLGGGFLVLLPKILSIGSSLGTVAAAITKAGGLLPAVAGLITAMGPLAPILLAIGAAAGIATAIFIAHAKQQANLKKEAKELSETLGFQIETQELAGIRELERVESLGLLSTATGGVIERQNAFAQTLLRVTAFSEGVADTSDKVVRGLGDWSDGIVRWITTGTTMTETQLAQAAAIHEGIIAGDEATVVLARTGEVMSQTAEQTARAREERVQLATASRNTALAEIFIQEGVVKTRAAREKQIETETIYTGVIAQTTELTERQRTVQANLIEQQLLAEAATAGLSEVNLDLILSTEDTTAALLAQEEETRILSDNLIDATGGMEKFDEATWTATTSVSEYTGVVRPAVDETDLLAERTALYNQKAEDMALAQDDATRSTISLEEEMGLLAGGVDTAREKANELRLAWGSTFSDAVLDTATLDEKVQRLVDSFAESGTVGTSSLQSIIGFVIDTAAEIEKVGPTFPLEESDRFLGDVAQIRDVIIGADIPEAAREALLSALGSAEAAVVTATSSAKASVDEIALEVWDLMGEGATETADDVETEFDEAGAGVTSVIEQMMLDATGAFGEISLTSSTVSGEVEEAWAGALGNVVTEVDNLQGRLDLLVEKPYTVIINAEIAEPLRENSPITRLQGSIEELEKRPFEVEVGLTFIDPVGPPIEPGDPIPIPIPTDPILIPVIIEPVGPIEFPPWIGPPGEDLGDFLGFRAFAMEFQDFGRAFSSFGGGLAKRFTEETLKPIQGELAAIEDAMKKREALLERTDIGATQRLALQQQLRDLEEDQIAVTEVLVEKKTKLAELEKARADFAFVQSQLKILEFVRDAGLEVSDIFGGLEFGLEANIEDLMAVTVRAMRAVIEQANRELETGSPSRKFMRIADDVIGGFVLGAQRALVPAMREMRQVFSDLTDVAVMPTQAPVRGDLSVQPQPIVIIVEKDARQFNAQFLTSRQAPSSGSIMTDFLLMNLRG